MPRVYTTAKAQGISVDRAATYVAGFWHRRKGGGFYRSDDIWGRRPSVEWAQDERLYADTIWIGG